MYLCLFAFVVGVCFFHLLPEVPSGFWLLTLLPAFALFLKLPILRPVLALICGFLWCLLIVTQQISNGLSSVQEGRDLEVHGVISSFPIKTGTLTRFDFDIQQAESTDPLPDKIRLTWYSSQSELEPGQFWRLRVRLKRPWGMRNPGGFDYERWLFSEGIRATGYVRDWSGNQRLESDSDSTWLLRQRYRISRQTANAVDDERVAALLNALTTGDRSGFTPTDWGLFTSTGTSHLIAISGLHIGMVAAWFLFLGSWAWRNSERLALRLPAIRAGAWLGLMAAFVYAALAGFAIPTQRALVMLGFGIGAVLLGRPLMLAHSLALALFAVVLIDPFAPLSGGFWLSFGAVAVIAFGLAGRLARPSLFRQWGRVQWIVALGLLPFLITIFGRVSLIAPLANIILVPWFSLILVPMALINLPLQLLPVVGVYWLKMTEALAAFTLSLLDWMAQLPYEQVYLPEPSLWVSLLSAAGIFYLLLPKGVPGRPLGLILVAPLMFNRPSDLDQGSLRFTLLYVGQGLSCVIETAEHVLVYDTGPQYPSGFNAVESALLPYLRGRGIARLDRLVLSNLDQDHAGGLQALQNGLAIGRIVSGEADKIPDAQDCVAGMSWRWDGVSFKFLYPYAGMSSNGSNNASCVLRIETATHSLLLTGDIEKEAEALLSADREADLDVNILVAPHHGSKTSSTPGFVIRAMPDYVLFSTGYRNRFGFPKEQIVERWRSVGADVFDTAESGAIQFTLKADDSLMGPEQFRLDHQRYWHSRWAE